MEFLTSLLGRRLGLTKENGLLITDPKTSMQTLVGQVRTVKITSAQILAMFTTPITVLAAPGAGLAHVVERVSVYKPAGTAYGGVAVGEDLVLKYTNAAGAQVSGVIETTGFLDQVTAQTRYVWAPATVGATAADITPVANAAVVAHLLAGEITTGTSDLYVRIWYDTIQTVYTAVS